MRYLDGRDKEVVENPLLHSETPSQIRVAVSAVVTAMTARHTTTDRSLISLFRRGHNHSSAFLLWRLVLRSPLKMLGMQVLMWMRIDSFFFAYCLARAWMISVSVSRHDHAAETLSAKISSISSWYAENSAKRSLILGDFFLLFENIQDDDILEYSLEESLT